MRKLYMIGIRWVGPSMRTDAVDLIAAQLGPWYRYNADTWFVATDAEAQAVALKVRNEIGTENSVVVVPIDPSGPIAGWAPETIWQILGLRNPIVNVLSGTASPAPTNLLARRDPYPG